jgi:hypothetical protein
MLQGMKVIIKSFTVFAIFAILLLSLSSASLPVYANSSPQVQPITATKEEPSTYFEFQAYDPDGDVLTFKWTITIECGEIIGPTEGTDFIEWYHPHNIDDPNTCPEEPVHDGSFSVRVSDGHGWVLVMDYNNGSASGTGSNPMIFDQPELAEIMFNKSSYKPDESGIFSVISNNDNINPDGIDSIQVRLKSSTDPNGLLITLTETQVNTGIFETQFSLSTSLASAGTRLKVSAGDTVTVTYLDQTTPSGAPANVVGTATVSGASTTPTPTPTPTPAPKTIAEIYFDKTTYGLNDVVRFEIHTNDDNVDVNTAQSIQASVKSTTDPTGLTITLVESGANTGIFSATISLTNQASTGTKLKVSPGDTVTVTYLDQTTPSGAPANIVRTVMVSGTPIQTDFSGDYNVNISVKSDPAGHAPFIGQMPNKLKASISGSQITITGSGAWVTVSGTLNSDGSFTAIGTGTVADFPNVSVRFVGTITAQGLNGDYTVGANGELPTGKPITYSINGQKTQTVTPTPSPTPTPTPAPREVPNAPAYVEEATIPSIVVTGEELTIPMTVIYKTSSEEIKGKVTVSPRAGSIPFIQKQTAEFTVPAARGGEPSTGQKEVVLTTSIVSYDALAQYKLDKLFAEVTVQLELYDKGIKMFKSVDTITHKITVIPISIVQVDYPESVADGEELKIKGKYSYRNPSDKSLSVHTVLSEGGKPVARSIAKISLGERSNQFEIAIPSSAGRGSLNYVLSISLLEPEGFHVTEEKAMRIVISDGQVPIMQPQKQSFIVSEKVDVKNKGEHLMLSITNTGNQPVSSIFIDFDEAGIRWVKAVGWDRFKVSEDSILLISEQALEPDESLDLLLDLDCTVEATGEAEAEAELQGDADCDGVADVADPDIDVMDMELDSSPSILLVPYPFFIMPLQLEADIQLQEGRNEIELEIVDSLTDTDTLTGEATSEGELKGEGVTEGVTVGVEIESEVILTDLEFMGDKVEIELELSLDLELTGEDAATGEAEAELQGDADGVTVGDGVCDVDIPDLDLEIDAPTQPDKPVKINEVIEQPVSLDPLKFIIDCDEPATVHMRFDILTIVEANDGVFVQMQVPEPGKDTEKFVLEGDVQLDQGLNDIELDLDTTLTGEAEAELQGDADGVIIELEPQDFFKYDMVDLDLDTELSGEAEGRLSGDADCAVDDSFMDDFPLDIPLPPNKPVNIPEAAGLQTPVQFSESVYFTIYCDGPASLHMRIVGEKPKDTEFSIDARLLLPPVIQFDDRPAIERAPASNLLLLDPSGKPVDAPRVGSEILIETEITNSLNMKLPFTYFVQVKDEDGFVLSLDWITGDLAPQQKLEPALRWMPEEGGKFTIETFVWLSVNDPEILSLDTTLEGEAVLQGEGEAVGPFD